ncbi:type III polyketide synthase [Telmatospirillum sp. J64-1]|uniref:type III polyketide synthase n=1 Tax=Telmatospirillum sp. J64-1 TaxID=2502183 RepID=UPI0021062CA8|nr:3-oxoacyl-[acyl-carrier-protein] synthase III C-terminal domain-containing protein [Telmatospirillum sp. J64-1]
MMQTTPRLLSLATAVPPYEVGREDAIRLAHRVFGGRSSHLEHLMPVFTNSGIEKRYSCVPPPWYERAHSWSERNRLFIANALTLMERATLDCLKQAGLGVENIDAIVAVSTSGIVTPSLDAQLLNRIGLRPDVQRLPVFGLGCAGGALGLGRAAALAKAQPTANVLLVVVECCGLTFRASDCSNSNIIATALFGDGAAAALLSCTGEGPAVTAWGEHTWPDSLDVMGWRVEDDGLGVVFSASIPALVRRDFRHALDAFLARHDLSLPDIRSFLLHPGGPKVLAALEDALELRNGTLDHERIILRDYGNMSAATVLFVLHRGLKEMVPGRSLVAAMGPGFTAGFVVLEAS